MIQAQQKITPKPPSTSSTTTAAKASVADMINSGTFSFDAFDDGFGQYDDTPANEPETSAVEGFIEEELIRFRVWNQNQVESVLSAHKFFNWAKSKLGV
jgi:hypothetical protein